MKQKENKKQKRYNHSFAQRLTRWVMLVLFVMMSILGYIVYDMSKSIALSFSVNTFHTNMKASARFLSSVMADVSDAVKNHLYEVEQHMGQPALLKQTMARIITLNPRIRKCDIDYVRDNAMPDMLREVAAADSACWSDPFYDDSAEKAPVVAYLQPVHDRQGNVVAVLSAELSLDFMTEQSVLLDSIFQKEVVQIDVTSKDDFQSYVLMRDGTYVTHPDRWHILKGNFYDHIKDDTEPGMAQKVIEKMKAGERSSSEEDIVLRVNRFKSFLFYIPIEHSNWNLAVSVSTISLNLFGIMVGVFMLLAIVAILFVTFFVCHLTIKRAVTPLNQLASAADKMGDGNLDTPLPVIRSRDEIHLLRDAFDGMQHSLTDYINELQQATSSRASMERELKIAHAIQMSMLPKTYPAFPDRHDIDIFGSVTPAKAVGGDLYDFFIRNDQLFFCIGDVSGKGVPASLVMAVTRFLFRNIASYTYEPAQIAVAINESLSSNNETGMFVTLFLGVLDLRSGLLNYANAGHNPPLLIREGSVSELPCDANIPVGVLPGFSYTAQQVQFQADDILFLYTDGLSEAEDIHQQQFGIERVMQVATNAAQQTQGAGTEASPDGNPSGTVADLVKAMSAAVSQFVGDAEQSDDLTMLAVNYTNNTTIAS